MPHSFLVPISVLKCALKRHIVSEIPLTMYVHCYVLLHCNVLLRTALQSHNDITFASMYDCYRNCVLLVAIEPVLAETFALDCTRVFGTSEFFAQFTPNISCVEPVRENAVFAARDMQFVHQNSLVLPHCIPWYVFQILIM